jgi:hypothetical protein
MIPGSWDALNAGRSQQWDAQSHARDSSRRRAEECMDLGPFLLA